MFDFSADANLTAGYAGLPGRVAHGSRYREHNWLGTGADRN
jgi:hypothetical protein